MFTFFACIFLLWCIHKCIKTIRKWIESKFGGVNYLCVSAAVAILFVLAVAGCIWAVSGLGELDWFIMIPGLMLAVACFEIIWCYALFVEHDEDNKDKLQSK